MPTVCELLGTSPAPGQIYDKAAQDHKDEPASALPFATETHKYIEQIKRNVATGVVDLKGDPWIRPCDPQIAASRLIASRKSGSRQAVDSAEVRDIVFRPLIFAWAPHLLLP